jgi:hypothetical protein
MRLQLLQSGFPPDSSSRLGWVELFCQLLTRYDLETVEIGEQHANGRDCYMKTVRLRSPRETLGGYILLPRLIYKVRLHARGELPQPYVANLLGTGVTLDGRLLTFSGSNAKALREAIVSSRSDDEVLAWVQQHARQTTASEQQAWARGIESYRPDAALLEYRQSIYPQLAARVDVGSLSVLDLIDMDEGRMSVTG